MRTNWSTMLEPSQTIVTSPRRYQSVDEIDSPTIYKKKPLALHSLRESRQSQQDDKTHAIKRQDRFIAFSINHEEKQAPSIHEILNTVETLKTEVKSDQRSVEEKPQLQYAVTNRGLRVVIQKQVGLRELKKFSKSCSFEEKKI